MVGVITNQLFTNTLRVGDNTNHKRIHIVKNRREQEAMLRNQLRTGEKIVETAGDIKDDAN